MGVLFGRRATATTARGLGRAVSCSSVLLRFCEELVTLALPFVLEPSMFVLPPVTFRFEEGLRVSAFALKAVFSGCKLGVVVNDEVG